MNVFKYVCCVQLYDKIEEINIAEQTDVRQELGNCSHAVEEVRDVNKYTVTVRHTDALHRKVSKVKQTRPFV